MTSTTKGIMPVTYMDGNPVGSGHAERVARRLNKLFMEMEEAVVGEMIK